MVHAYEGYAYALRAWQILSVISIKDVIAARGYTFFVFLLYVMVGGLVTAVGLCVQVGYSVSDGTYN